MQAPGRVLPEPPSAALCGLLQPAQHPFAGCIVCIQSGLILRPQVGEALWSGHSATVEGLSSRPQTPGEFPWPWAW